LPFDSFIHHSLSLFTTRARPDTSASIDQMASRSWVWISLLMVTTVSSSCTWLSD